MKSDHFVLTGGNDDNYPDSKIILRLSHKLEQLRRNYSERCEALIHLRDIQLQEIQELSKALSEHSPASSNIPNIHLNEISSTKT